MLKCWQRTTKLVPTYSTASSASMIDVVVDQRSHTLGPEQFERRSIGQVNGPEKRGKLTARRPWTSAAAFARLPGGFARATESLLRRGDQRIALRQALHRARVPDGGRLERCRR